VATGESQLDGAEFDRAAAEVKAHRREVPACA
jgi:hypothetical protein